MPTAERAAERSAFLASLLADPAADAPLGWLRELRSRALERVNALTLPTTRDEDWRFTDLSALYKLAFKAAAPVSEPVGANLEPYWAPEAATRLVFVDGHFAPGLSVNEAQHGIEVRTLAEAVASEPDLARARLGTIAPHDDDAFRAINTAHLADGAVVVARRNATGRSPVQLLFVATQPGIAVHPRVLVVAETGAEATVVEEYVGLAAEAYLVNGVTEIAVGPGARVRHVRVQRESPAAFHISTCAARIERDASFASVAVTLGAKLSRYNPIVRQAGEGITSRLDGLALITDRQLADTHSFIDHAFPHGTSRQLHKCVVAGSAHAVFNGRILVEKGAQLTNSEQESRNLLLSPRAHVDTKPQLEIFADDVKCAHGATVGQLEAEELFYLRSRGLGEAEARNLLTYGFAAEIVDRIPVPSIVAALRRAVLQQTHAGA